MAPTNIACNNCASPSSSPADPISAKWKGKKWKILIIRDIDFLKMRVQSAHRIYSKPYSTLKLNHLHCANGLHTLVYRIPPNPLTTRVLILILHASHILSSSPALSSNNLLRNRKRFLLISSIDLIRISRDVGVCICL